MENLESLMINNLSFSQICEFIGSSWEWQNRRFLSNWDNTTWVSAAIWIMCHKFVESYITQWDIDLAIDTANKCLFQWSDWEMYIINPDLNWEKEEKILQAFETKKIDFKKTWTPEQIYKWVKKWIDNFLRETIDYWDILWMETMLQYEVKDIIWGKKEVFSEVPFKWVLDIVAKSKSNKTLAIEWKTQMIPRWKIFIRDLKFKSAFSDSDFENPWYIFQAIMYYYLCRQHFWEEPTHCIFHEIKLSENKDGSSQHQEVIFPYIWDTFELYKVFFWRYLEEMFERMRWIQNRDLLFNVFDFQRWKEEWKKQCEFYLNIPQWTLKQNIVLLKHKREWSKVQQQENIENPLHKIIDATRDSREKDLLDLQSMENKIRLTFRDFRIRADFSHKLEWLTYDIFYYLPARWTKMQNIESLTKEISQSIWIDTVSIDAPVPWTKFIWVYVPKKERQFVKFDDKKSRKKWTFWIWVSTTWEEVVLDLDENPHLLVAWRTWSWKSEQLKVIIQQALNEWEVHIIDPKKIWLLSLRKSVTTYSDSTDKALEMLMHLRVEMHRRFEYLKNQNKEKFKWKKIFIIVDEFNSFMLEQKEVKELFETSILDIANLWRAAWVHLVLATQRPDVKVINGRIKWNISTRICFSVGSQIDSKVVLDNIWAEKLLWKGDWILKSEWSTMRFQSYYIWE